MDLGAALLSMRALCNGSTSDPCSPGLFRKALHNESLYGWGANEALKRQKLPMRHFLDEVSIEVSICHDFAIAPQEKDTMIL